MALFAELWINMGSQPKAKISQYVEKFFKKLYIYYCFQSFHGNLHALGN